MTWILILRPPRLSRSASTGFEPVVGIGIILMLWARSHGAVHQSGHVMRSRRFRGCIVTL
jgi:hypothetical protein